MIDYTLFTFGIIIYNIVLTYVEVCIIVH